MEASQQHIDVLECPVCSEIMEAPIRTCILGHSICDECFNNITICPLCRGEMSQNRNYALENLGQSLTFKCTNSLEGCDFHEQIQRVKQHNKFCKYTIAECPIKYLDNCRWTGKRQNIMDHCLQKHPNNTYFANKRTLVCKNFLEVEDTISMTMKHYFVMFKAYGEMFKLVLDLNYTTGFMLWRMVYCGPNEDAANYKFSLNFQDPYGLQSKLHLEAQCQPTELDKVASTVVYITTTKRRLKSYCFGIDLYYTVSIHKVLENSACQNSVSEISNLSTFAPEGYIYQL